jgi:hypothetical protein
MIKVWRYVDEKCRQDPERFHPSLATLAVASIFERQCARDTTMVEYDGIFSLDLTKREFFYREVLAAVENDFEGWVNAISASYTHIPPGGLRTSMTESKLNIISPFHIILECLILAHVYSLSAR